jgi:hypothetical protein
MRGTIPARGAEVKKAHPELKKPDDSGRVRDWPEIKPAKFL